MTPLPTGRQEKVAPGLKGGAGVGRGSGPVCARAAGRVGRSCGSGCWAITTRAAASGSSASRARARSPGRVGRRGPDRCSPHTTPAPRPRRVRGDGLRSRDGDGDVAEQRYRRDRYLADREPTSCSRRPTPGGARSARAHARAGARGVGGAGQSSGRRGGGAVPDHRLWVPWAVACAVAAASWVLVRGRRRRPAGRDRPRR